MEMKNCVEVICYDYYVPPAFGWENFWRKSMIDAWKIKWEYVTQEAQLISRNHEQSSQSCALAATNAFEYSQS